MSDKENVIIVGGGPAGLAAAIYAARAFLKPLIIAGSPPGGQLMLTTDVENYPGFQAIQGPELIAKMRSHAEHFGTRFVDDNVTGVDFSDDANLQITSASGQTFTARSVLLTTGADAQWLNIDSEQRLRGKGVSACATCDGFFFKGKKVAVVGGGDTAMEEALTLTKFASHVFIIHRRDEFRASKIMTQRVMNHEAITVLWGTQVAEVCGDTKVEGVKLTFTTDSSRGNKHMSGKENDTVDVQGVFIAIGHKPNSKFLVDSGILMHETGYIYTSAVYAWEKLRDGASGHDDTFDFAYRHATNKKGVFAAGDVVDYMYRQAATAVGMGVEAALEIERYLEKKE